MPGLGLSIPDVAARGRAALDPAAAALIARMSVAPGEARAALIDALVRALKDAGVWARLDLLQVMAAHDAQAARLNWVSASYSLAAVNAPTFTADRGYNGDGSTSYLDTGFQPGISAGSQATQNSTHLGAWSLGNMDPSGNDAGNTSLYFAPRNGGVLVGRCNDPTGATVAVADSLGHSLFSRAASTGYSRYRNAGSLGDVTQASGTLAPHNLFVGARNVSGSGSGYSSRRIAAVHAGASLSGAQVAALYAALNTYLTAAGAA